MSTYSSSSKKNSGIGLTTRAPPPPGLGYAAVLTSSAKTAAAVPSPLPPTPSLKNNGPASVPQLGVRGKGKALPSVSSPLEKLWGSSAGPPQFGDAANGRSGGGLSLPAPPPTVVSTPLELTYPLHSEMRVTVRPPTAEAAETGTDDVTVCGTVFATDDRSGMVVLQCPVSGDGPEKGRGGGKNGAAVVSRERSIHMFHHSHVIKCAVVREASADGVAAAAPVERLPTKQLEVREERAIRLAMKSLAHINLEASSHAQALFDRLVKACNDVSWAKDQTTIIVLDQVRIVPPYSPGDCSLLGGENALSSNRKSVALAQESLERVKRIVATFQEK